MDAQAVRDGDLGDHHEQGASRGDFGEHESQMESVVFGEGYLAPIGKDDGQIVEPAFEGCNRAGDDPADRAPPCGKFQAELPPVGRAGRPGGVRQLVGERVLDQVGRGQVEKSKARRSRAAAFRPLLGPLQQRHLRPELIPGQRRQPVRRVLRQPQPPGFGVLDGLA
jgi:hypothetical protein